MYLQQHSVCASKQELHMAATCSCHGKGLSTIHIVMRKSY